MIENRKRAIITFDYEVFLGRETGTVENCVLKPTEEILKILRANNAKAVFFVDTTWLIFLKDNFPDDFRKVAGQLQAIRQSGSSVELHLHPQWPEAEKTEHGISFGGGIKNYRLHTLGSDRIVELFKISSDLLENITNEPVRAFRAGGWCIEPFGPVKAAFDATNIKYDFSIVSGMYIKEGKAYDFDHSMAPEAPFYPFNDDVMNPVTGGPYYEFPVSTYRNNPVYRLLNKILLRLYKDKIYGDGKGIKETSFFKPGAFYRRLELTKATLTLDRTSHQFFKYLLRAHFGKSSFLVVVSHPKSISAQALKNLSWVVKKYKTLNSEELDNFIKLAD